jgi:effector-binding domain-containing protein
MLTEPKIEQRAEQRYVGIRSHVAMSEIATVLPPLISEVFAWLGKRQKAPAGPPFFRYRVIEMSGRLEIDVGVPVASPVSGDQRVIADRLPGGLYATVIHTGNPAQLVEVNASLQQWGSRKGLKWQTSNGERGTVWASRLEIYLTDPASEPDPNKWQTEVAYLIADDKVPDSGSGRGL